MPELRIPVPWASGPEVPFPLKEVVDLETAGKFGFCRDCPFPMKTDPHRFAFAQHAMQRELGLGTYKANEIAGHVTISASGVAPGFNVVVQLVQLPLMIWPPRFALYFTNPEVAMPATRPFKVEATLQTPQRLKAILVQDADGVHEVKVENF